MACSSGGFLAAASHVFTSLLNESTFMPLSVAATRPSAVHGWTTARLPAGWRMTGRFALIAWPGIYRASGIMTFVVDQDGIVFRKDLGPDTARRAAAIKVFEPDLGWARIEITQH